MGELDDGDLGGTLSMSILDENDDDGLELKRTNELVVVRGSLDLRGVTRDNACLEKILLGNNILLIGETGRF